MVEHAKHEFELAQVQSDGKTTLREHLEAAQRASRKPVAALIGPDLPPAGQHWFQWWRELSAGRQSGMDISPISWGDIEAWSRLTRRVLDAWDLLAIRCIDAEFIGMARAKASAANSSSKGK